MQEIHTHEFFTYFEDDYSALSSDWRSVLGRTLLALLRPGGASHHQP